MNFLRGHLRISAFPWKKMKEESQKCSKITWRNIFQKKSKLSNISILHGIFCYRFFHEEKYILTVLFYRMAFNSLNKLIKKTLTFSA